MLYAPRHVILGPSHRCRMHVSCMDSQYLYRAHSLRIHLTVTPMVPAIWAFVRLPFAFSRSIHLACDSFRFMLSRWARSMYLHILLLHVHMPPLFLMEMRLVRSIRDRQLTMIYMHHVCFCRVGLSHYKKA